MELRLKRAFEINGVTVDFAAERLRDRAGRDVALRPQSFAVLRYLAEHAERIVTKDELMEAVWRGIAVTDDSLVQCIHDIRRALRDESQSVLRNVPRRGYQLVMPPPTAPRRVGALAAGLCGALALALVGLWWWRDQAPPGRPPSIAVLPFNDMSADGSLRYMGSGVAEDIIVMLARSPDVSVVARTSSFVYGGQPVDVREVGAELGVDYVLEGSVRREGDTLRIVAQLNDASTGRHLWAERFDKASADPPTLQDEVTGRIIATLVGEVGALRRAQYREAWGMDTARLGEYDYYLRGHDDFMTATTRAENDHAARIWREGLARYPESPLLKVKLAWYHFRLGLQLLSDDPAGDFTEGARLVRDVLAEENLAPQVHRLARWLLAYVMAREGDFEGAVREVERVVELAPYDAFPLTDLSEILASAGEYQRAVELLAIGEARDPGRRDAYHRGRGYLYRLMGQYPESLEEYARAGELNAYHRLSRAITNVRLGEIGDARADVRRALALDRI
jgi:TolB-like protein/DNA-binding winged helix-turn-helix (wHTH) protein